MGSSDRFYQLEMRNRPVLKGDIGSLLKIEGLVVGGGGTGAVLLLPGSTLTEWEEINKFHRLTEEEWTDYLQRSDNPEVLVMPEKAFHRKVRFEISGAVQQKVWVADNYQCMYCGGKMGKVQLTIDHFTSLENKGANDTSNFLSCCRRDNKDKGSEDPKSFCDRRGLDYDFYVDYLKNRKVL